jgi:CheY-like chemotaxis protein
MNVELRCPSCGRGFVVDEADSHDAPCPGCGVILGQAASPSGPSGTVEGVGPPKSAADGVSARPSVPAGGSGASRDEPVVCPRCGLHFAPHAATARTALDSERKKVLVVEDMDYFLDIARDALEPRFLVEAATTIEQARAALTQGEIDLILLDLTLSGDEDGVGLLREMPFKPCPILIFTAEDESVMYGETWERLQALGADDVVIKGMNVGESILRKVGALLGQPIEEDGGGR